MILAITAECESLPEVTATKDGVPPFSVPLEHDVPRPHIVRMVGPAVIATVLVMS